MENLQKYPLVPVSDPMPVRKTHDYFESLLRCSGWISVQSPEPNNQFVSIKKLGVSGHPTGALLSESQWKDCSIYDVAAVVNCVAARKICK